MKVLVVAAHPDDEVFGCGGTIAYHNQARDEVLVITLTDGVTSRAYFPGMKRKLELSRCAKKITSRRKEFFSAARVLGVKKGSAFLLGLPDQRLDAIPLIDIIKNIEKLAGQFAPDLVYTHHWGDLNRDHRVCAEAVLTAFRPLSRTFKKSRILGFEIPGNMDLLPPLAHNRFTPDYFVDISSFLETKLAAVNAYKSELCLYPHPLSPDALRRLAGKRGKVGRFKFAEAFVRLKQGGIYEMEC